MATWSSTAPNLPNGSSWGNITTDTLTLNTLKITLTMKSARGTGNTFYIRISAKFDVGSYGTYYPPDNVFFFVGNDYKAYNTPGSDGKTLTKYYTATGSGSRTAGVSRKNGDYIGSGVAAYGNISIPNVITYTITYKSNGGTGTSTSQIKTSGTNITLLDNPFTYTGYSFSEWNTAADGSGTSYQAGATYSTDANATLYAQWVKSSLPIYGNVGGTIHQVEKIYANVGGTIKECTVYANVGGVIKTLT